MLTTILLVIQFIFTIVMGLYFYSMLRDKNRTKETVKLQSDREMRKLSDLRQIQLSKPLAEKTRPKSFSEIVGQKNGLRALRAALCGPNPQHVIIYGPPGVGKTAAARLVLEEAKKSGMSPFGPHAKFVETDATVMRFDERNIADPLIGSVHDPIYQGAGAYGPAGIPQPKPGAVTKAHGGILFIDEIGELHPIQMNKLLKVLEDRKVFLESAYYSQDDGNIPLYIHEIFQKGLPADFRLIGATTRTPEEIPPAIRSRCVEIFFDPLCHKDLISIAQEAARKGGFQMEEGVSELAASYSSNGRDVVNMVQVAGSLAQVELRKTISVKDMEWVLDIGKYSPRPNHTTSSATRIGCVSGLAVTGAGSGLVMDIETLITDGSGITLCGITQEESIESGGRRLTRMSTAKSSVKNALAVLKQWYHLDLTNRHIHVNIPGGMPVDGPSAGTAIFTCLYSAALSLPVAANVAFTGELSISGKVKPVGGVVAKVEAALSCGIKKVFIPKDNWQERFEDMDIEVIPVSHVREILSRLFPIPQSIPASLDTSVAKSV